MPAPAPRPRGRPRKAAAAPLPSTAPLSAAAPLPTPDPTAQISRYPSRAKGAAVPKRQAATRDEPVGTPPRRKLRSAGKVQEESSSSDSEEEVALLLTPRKAGGVRASGGRIGVILPEGSVEDSEEEEEGMVVEKPGEKEASEEEDELSDDQIDMEVIEKRHSRAPSGQNSSDEKEEDAGVFSRARGGAYKAYFLPLEDKNGVELWNTEERDRLIRLFEENGGKVVELLKESDLVFTPPRTTADHWTRLISRANQHDILVINPCFISESVKAAELSRKDGKKRKRPVEEYRLRLPLPPKKPREPFTEEDEEMLCKYWKEHKVNGSTQLSLWDKLEEKEPRHTAQSWANHWRAMEAKRRGAKKAAERRMARRASTASSQDAPPEEEGEEVDQLESDQDLPTIGQIVAAKRKKKFFDARAHDEEEHEARQAEKENRRNRTSGKSSAKDKAPEPENRLQAHFDALATHYSLPFSLVRSIFYYSDLDPTLCAQICAIHSRPKSLATLAELELQSSLWTPEEDETLLEGSLGMTRGGRLLSHEVVRKRKQHLKAWEALTGGEEVAFPDFE